MKKENDGNNTSFVSGIQVAIILLGILVTPVLLASSSLGNQLAISQMILVVLVGSMILTLLAAINISIGAKARLPTYGIVKFSFGSQGAIAINIIMAISLFGWIVVTANMFGHTLQDLIVNYFNMMIPLPILVGLGCIIFVAATAFGFEFLGKVSKWAIPIITILMLVIFYLSLKSSLHFTNINTMSFGAGVSSIVGTIIVLVATSPDFGSFVQDRKHAILASILTFTIAYPLLFIIGAIPSSLTSEGSLLSAMAVIGATLPASILLVFACITGNSGNMFQGTLVVSTLLVEFKKWKITVVLGGLATIVASFDIMSLFIPFLLFLGIVIPPISGIYIADFFMCRKVGYDENLLMKEKKVKISTFIAWGIGSLVGFLTVNNYFTLTAIPSLDSILIASICYAMFTKSLKTMN